MKTIWKWVIGVLVFLIFCGIGIAFVLTKPKQNIYITVPISILDNPKYILTSAYSRTGDLPVDENASGSSAPMDEEPQVDREAGQTLN